MISIIHTYENSEGKRLELPEVWSEYPVDAITKLSLLHSKEDINGAKAKPGHVWIKSYFMSPPDETWKEIGTTNG